MDNAMRRFRSGQPYGSPIPRGRCRMVSRASLPG